MNASVRTALLAVFLAASAVAPAVAAEGQPQGVPAAGEAAAAPPAPDKSSGEPSKVYIAAGIGPGLNARFKVNGNTVTFSDQFQGTTDKSPLVAVNVASFGLALNSKTLVGMGRDLEPRHRLRIAIRPRQRDRRPARSGLRLAGERQAPSDADLHSDLAVLLVERDQARQLAVRRRLPGVHVPELRRAGDGRAASGQTR